VNPVSGPVFVKGARPGATLAVELLEFRPQPWGWTASHEVVDAPNWLAGAFLPQTIFVDA